VPQTVDHCLITVNATEDRNWDSKVPTDGVHYDDRVNSTSNSPEGLSEGVKRLKPVVLAKLIEAFQMEQCLIFARTQLDCDNLCSYLTQLGGGQSYKGQKMEKGKENPYSCTVLHAGLRQDERNRNLESFREGDVRFLICTDVAAKGIDIRELPYVINMTLPDKPEYYIHRVGRVGRAEKNGLAFSLVGMHQEKQWYHKCNRSDRGRGCRRTQTVDEGGCTIWFDELKMLEDIEVRIQQKVTRLQLSELTKVKDKVNELQARIAKQKNEAAMETAKHVNVLRPAVEELALLEVHAQQNFLQMSYGLKGDISSRNGSK